MSDNARDYELKPCPWCGAAAEFVQDRTSNWWYIGTPCKCEIMFMGTRKSDAAKWWNRREQESKVEAERDKWRAIAEKMADVLACSDTEDSAQWWQLRDSVMSEFAKCTKPNQT